MKYFTSSAFGISSHSNPLKPSLLRFSSFRASRFALRIRSVKLVCMVKPKARTRRGFSRSFLLSASATTFTLLG
ncbi:hypothetical protein HanRHA438_Chr05g0228581 [Helianthus annuus]|nr:hypothetical protein HanRHA438_Chr05g0228581 [Helianthus annuus]